MRPFIPESDAFQFTNDFDLTAQEASQLLEIIPGVLLDLVRDICTGEIIRMLSQITIVPIPLPWVDDIRLIDVIPDDLIIKPVLSFILTEVADLVDELKDPLVSDVGFCGGMAFSGYDFYLQDRPVSHLGNIPPAAGDLHDYLFQRLLDSLELNGSNFVKLWAKVHLLPIVSPVASAALLAAAGSIGGPLGSLIAALIGASTDFLDLGGSKSILRPTIAQWPMIKNKLDEQAAWPVGLIFGNKSSLFDQHQVLAIGYTDDGSGRATLDIWDNNDGNRSNTLSIDFRGSELKVTALANTNITDENKQIKGIFLEKYTFRQPPLSLRLGKWLEPVLHMMS